MKEKLRNDQDDTLRPTVSKRIEDENRETAVQVLLSD